jgi:Polysaccharide lyase
VRETRGVGAFGAAVVAAVALASTAGSAASPAVAVVSSIKAGDSLSGHVRWTAEVAGLERSSAAVTRVVFSIDGVEQWSEQSQPYVYKGDTGMLDSGRLLAGSHRFAVRAVFANGTVATDSVVANAAAGVRKLHSNFEQPGKTSPLFSAFEHRGVFEQGFPMERQLAWVTAPVRRGRHALRFTIQPGDRYGRSSGERALLRNTDHLNFEGSDTYYAFSMLFPEDWTAPPGWGLFFELHGDSRFILAPIRLNARENSARLDMSTGACNPGGLCRYHRNHHVLSTLSKGRWNDFVVRIRFSKTNRGIVEICHQVAGERDWRMVKRLRRIPTLPYNPGQGDASIYLQWGLYTGSGTSTRVIYGDNFTFATKLADVAAAFPQKRPTCKFTPAN